MDYLEFKIPPGDLGQLFITRPGEGFTRSLLTNVDNHSWLHEMSNMWLILWRYKFGRKSFFIAMENSEFLWFLWLSHHIACSIKQLIYIPEDYKKERPN